jgi:hypothetical protein
MTSRFGTEAGRHKATERKWIRLVSLNAFVSQCLETSMVTESLVILSGVEGWRNETKGYNH